MAKDKQENIRVDLLTSLLVNALVGELSKGSSKMTKSQIYRTAVYRMAKEELSEKDFQQYVNAAIDIDNY